MKTNMPKSFAIISTVTFVLIISKALRPCAAAEMDYQNKDDNKTSFKKLILSENVTNSELLGSFVSTEGNKQVSLNLMDLLFDKQENRPLGNKSEADISVKSEDVSSISNKFGIDNQGEKSSSKPTPFDMLSKIIGKRALIFKKRLQSILTAELDRKSQIRHSSAFELKPDEGMDYKNAEHRREKDSALDYSQSSRTDGARQFQFVFHPYLPYGKEMIPDEKISIQDVLPVKMVKFIKSMVEEAPWEAMFMKMVRMVVDQFVDKIIEKMFAGKDEEDHEKWRSADGPLSLSPSVIPGKTVIQRLRRSAEIVFNPPKEVRWDNDLTSSNHLYKDGVSKDPATPVETSWLDLFLDYVFPGEDKDSEKADKLASKSRHKRDVANDAEEDFDAIKLMRAKLIDKIENFIFTSKFRRAFKDFIKYRLIKRFLLPLKTWTDVTDTKNVDLYDQQNYLKSSHRMKSPGESWRILMKPLVSSQDNVFNLVRRKRSLRRYDSKKYGNKVEMYKYEQDLEDLSDKKDKEAKRLWQSSLETKSSHFKRDDCSLRRACNAGRLLARLPSVEDITLQLKGNYHEPHWDALLWGMKKKRCSRLFCSRQRSPKGSKTPWYPINDRRTRTFQSSLDKPQSDINDIDSTTIIPIQ